MSAHRCPSCGETTTYVRGYGFRCFACTVSGTPAPVDRSQRTPVAEAEGVDPLRWHYGSFGTTPLIPVEDWPVAVGDTVTGADGREAEVTALWWRSAYIALGEDVWCSAVALRYPNGQKAICDLAWIGRAS